MKKIYLVMFSIIIINSLIVYLYDLNTLHQNSYVLLVLEILNFGIVFFLIRDCLGRYNNITSIFIIFWALYLVFPLFYRLDLNLNFVHLNNAALIAFSLLFIFILNLSKTKFNKETNFEKEYFSEFNFRGYGFVIIVISIMMEAINFFRAGGFSELSKGKANFISQTQDLIFTLPSFDILFIGIILYLMGDIFSKKKAFQIDIVFYLIILLLCAYFAIVSLRTNILAMMALILMLKTYNKTIKKINIKLIIIAFLAFYMLSFIGQNRSMLAQINTSNITEIFSSLEFNIFTDNNDTKVKSNEYTSAFENFDMFNAKPEKLQEEYVLGESFIDGLFYMFPRYLYPFGEKPLQITTVFRDNYVVERVDWGTQASTGFSTIIEGYINGGIFGVLFYYIIIALFFAYMEIKRHLSTSLIFNVFYLSIIPVLFTFSRRAFAIIYSGMFKSFIFAAIIVLGYIMLKKLLIKQNSNIMGLKTGVE